jgi:hypothetical protein
MIESLETRRCMSAAGGMDAMLMTQDAPTETAVDLSWSEINQAVKDAAGAVIKAMGECGV